MTNTVADEVPVYDLRGLHCPMPVLKTRKRMKDMPSGAKLWVETTDPLALIDIPHFAQENGHTLLESKANAQADGHLFLLQRG